MHPLMYSNQHLKKKRHFITKGALCVVQKSFSKVKGYFYLTFKCSAGKIYHNVHPYIIMPLAYFMKVDFGLYGVL